MSQQAEHAQILMAQREMDFPYTDATMPGIIDSRKLRLLLRNLIPNDAFKSYGLTVFEYNDDAKPRRYAVEMYGMITDIDPDLERNSVDIDGDTHFISPGNMYKLGKASRGGSIRKKQRKHTQRRNKTYKQKRLRKKSKKHRH
jgi:hypothetical protein